MWEIPADFRGITTNGSVKSDGRAVMGRGVAAQAKLRYPGIDLRLGSLITRYGNYIHWVQADVFSFPVKDYWKEKASITIIRRSVQELIKWASGRPKARFVLPVPGIGAGGLEPQEVFPLLSDLPDNMTIAVLSQSIARLGGY